MPSLLETIAEETHGKSYKSYKYTFDDVSNSGVDYDDHSEITWERYGETDPPKKPLNLKEYADRLKNDDAPALFCHFLDGSRRTYKVDDIAYNNNVFPIIAGQVGISCCTRVEKVMQKFKYVRKLAIALPQTANQVAWKKDSFSGILLDKINELENLSSRGIQFTDILFYSYKLDDPEKIENKGIAKIQDLMIEQEIAMVESLVDDKIVDSETYLMKDGSLQYNVDHLSKSKKSEFQTNFNYVVGVSKSFNPENCKSKNGKNNSDTIGELPLYSRTPVSLYTTSRNKGMAYAVWYVRVRDRKYTYNAFDGILKLEKILPTDSQSVKVLKTQEVDLITANIINERNPTCYGADERWANHLYPVYITEKFAKSKYLSNTMFLNIF